MRWWVARHYRILLFFFFFKQKTAYEILADWSSDVCSSDLISADGTFLNLKIYVALIREMCQGPPVKGRDKQKTKKYLYFKSSHNIVSGQVVKKLLV